MLAVSGCGSQQPVRSNPPHPAAWAMLPAPDLMTPLNGIISPSESESQQSQGR
nr:Rz1 family lipoprotein [Erwinia tracheiphila]